MSDSFGNLPSPVNESKTTKMLFKANKKDSDSDNKKSGRVRKIKFEGDTSEEVDDSRIEKKKEFDANILKDVDKLVFTHN